MEVNIKERKTGKIYIEKESKINKFLYNTKFGRIILKLLILPFISKISGIFMDSPLSKKMIRNFIYKNNIDMNDYEEKKYVSFNDFFTRKIKKNKRKINLDKKSLISPCDGKLSVYKLNEKNMFKIKNSYYSVSDLVGEEKTYEYALIFRLCVDDYHRYSFIDDGKVISSGKIKGLLHTVRPIAQYKYKIFSQNERHYTIIDYKNLGEVIQIEVGALLVGKIINHDKKVIKRGEEKGYFKFGASTIVILINDVLVDDDIILNSSKEIETIVKLGEKIGVKK